MSPKLDQQLCQRHRRIFAERNGDPTTSAMGRGFECGDGWYALIDALCSSLQCETDERGAPQLFALQVKEKLGTLRFCVRGASERQRALIERAVINSANVCEICGGAALLRNARTAWLNAHCTDHMS